MWVRNLLKRGFAKSLPLVDLESDKSLEVAKEKMDLFDTNLALVFSGDAVVGIVERADVEACLSSQSARSDSKIIELVKANFLTAHPNDLLRDCLLAMQYHQLQEIPVIEDGLPVGMIEIQEIIMALSDKAQSLRSRPGLNYHDLQVDGLKEKFKHLA